MKIVSLAWKLKMLSIDIQYDYVLMKTKDFTKKKFFQFLKMKKKF